MAQSIHYQAWANLITSRLGPKFVSAFGAASNLAAQKATVVFNGLTIESLVLDAGEAANSNYYPYETAGGNTPVITQGLPTPVNGVITIVNRQDHPQPKTFFGSGRNITTIQNYQMDPLTSNIFEVAPGRISQPSNIAVMNNNLSPNAAFQTQMQFLVYQNYSYGSSLLTNLQSWASNFETELNTTFNVSGNPGGFFVRQPLVYSQPYIPSTVQSSPPGSGAVINPQYLKDQTRIDITLSVVIPTSVLTTFDLNAPINMPQIVVKDEVYHVGYMENEMVIDSSVLISD